MKGWFPKKVEKINEHQNHLYTLDVYIVDGPMTEAFAKRNKVICRTIEIKGSQTLSQLHDIIFDAFDREEEHMYEFQFGKGPHDPKGDRYVLSMAMNNPFADGTGIKGDVARTTIGSLGLKVDQSFGYWFDFGDDWYHQINVVAIADKVPDGKYPRVTKRIGKSPPQYANFR